MVQLRHNEFAVGRRLIGGVHALTGIRCGWSTGFFFATVNRLHESPPEAMRS